MDRRSIYLINPKADHPPYFGAEVCAAHGSAPVAFIADLAITTVAALVPNDFLVKLCDAQVGDVDLDFSGAYVGITGKSSQVGHMVELANAFRQRGRTVIFGGPHASLAADELRPYCDILVRGEIETIAPQLFADLARGSWRDVYEGNRPPLDEPPRPRWAAYPNHRALQGCVQTSRGCPFACDFCDVIQYVGRRVRHKPVDSVLAELDALYETGYRTVFLADDNLTAHRRRARELLAAIAAWNENRPAGRMFFNTQVSIDAADDADLLDLCGQAGINEVFVGIETPNEDGLAASGKRQNVGRDALERLVNFARHGIGVMGGMIVGFDADGPDIFERQADFAARSAVPIFSLGALVAPNATPLRARIKAEGRLLPLAGVGAAMAPWRTNIVPARISNRALSRGIRWLANRLYDPDAFADRLLRAIALLPKRSVHAVDRTSAPPRAVERAAVNVVRSMPSLGPRESVAFDRIVRAAASNGVAKRHAMSSVFRYMQVRHMYQNGGFWGPDGGRLAES
ncbi:MAG: radical SAM protein [Myxococcales bacterium FL481]|nr:MAG: radical SAM protein [Myxococcales bacterium FL481]